MWLIGGDQNIAFFHAVTKGRRAKNCITAIEDETGNPVHEEEEISKVFEAFYQQLFTSNGHDDYHTVEETISACITEEMNDLLCCIPEEEEVKTTIFAIHADKAPGSDGFSASFYQSFWSMLGPDIY